MRIFVGTLYTIEAEFDECVAAIERQTYRNFEHFVFANLPKQKAHETLYRAFMERRHEFDLLAKIDADMVLADDRFFEKAVAKFEKIAWLDDLEIAVHDFFSEEPIWGMHIYRNSVRWPEKQDGLFTDKRPIAEYNVVHDRSELAPAAFHCKNPSPFQSFHYGVHCGMKFVQPDRKKMRRDFVRHCWRLIERTRRHFLRTLDRRPGFAVLGAELVCRGGIRTRHLDNTDPFLREIFGQYENMSAREIGREIRRLAQRQFGFLPSALRGPVLSRTAHIRAIGRHSGEGQ